jgi:hypothetical protein
MKKQEESLSTISICIRTPMLCHQMELSVSKNDTEYENIKDVVMSLESQTCASQPSISTSAITETETVLLPALECLIRAEVVPFYIKARLGQTCKPLRSVWNENQNISLEPVLETVSELVESHTSCHCGMPAFSATLDQEYIFPAVDERCMCEFRRLCHECRNDSIFPTPDTSRCTCQNDVLRLDPRRNPQYPYLSTTRKCKLLLQTATFLTSTSEDSFAPFRSTPDFGHWEYLLREKQRGFSGSPDLDFLVYSRPRLLAWLESIVIQKWAQTYTFFSHELFQDEFEYWDEEEREEETFLQYVDIEMKKLVPATENKIKEYIRDSRRPFLRFWSVLGPVLTNKLDLMAPFLDKDCPLDEDCYPVLPIIPNVEPVLEGEREFMHQHLVRWLRPGGESSSTLKTLPGHA